MMRRGVRGAFRAAGASGARRRGLAAAAAARGRFQRVRGTTDLFGEEERRYGAAERALRRAAESHGFGRVRTPVLEHEGVFTATLGGTSDVVSKEMYRFDDGGGRQVVLRPEATAGVTRALLERGYSPASAPAHERVARHYYHGPMFRRERPQRGRYRQFQQFGVELVGDASPHADVDVVLAAWSAARELGLAPFLELNLNSLGDRESRDRYSEALHDFLWPRRDLLSDESRARLERGSVLRVLDSTDTRDLEVLDGAELGKHGSNRHRTGTAPVLWSFLNDDSRARFEAVRRALQHLGVPFTLNPRLVRGLDYYCHTTFELIDTTHRGRQAAVLAGGRYDGLATALGARAGQPPVPAVGWAAGVDRLVLMRESLGLGEAPAPWRVAVATVRGKAPADVLTPLGREALLVAERLRGGLLRDGDGADGAGAAAVITLNDGNTTRQMQVAARSGCDAVVVVGEDELARGAVALKDLHAGEQTEVPLDELLPRVAEMRARHAASSSPSS